MNKRFTKTDLSKQFTIIGELTVFEKYPLPKLSLLYRSCSSWYTSESTKAYFIR